MTINDLADAMEEDHYDCQNCGRTLEVATNDVAFCDECCPHENTESELTGTYCQDCGNKVD